jgi:hypothetical protein
MVIGIIRYVECIRTDWSWRKNIRIWLPGYMAKALAKPLSGTRSRKSLELRNVLIHFLLLFALPAMSYTSNPLLLISNVPPDVATLGYISTISICLLRILIPPQTFYTKGIGKLRIFMYRSSYAFSIAFVGHFHARGNKTGYQT